MTEREARQAEEKLAGDYLKGALELVALFEERMPHITWSLDAAPEHEHCWRLRGTFARQTAQRFVRRGVHDEVQVLATCAGIIWSELGRPMLPEIVDFTEVGA